MILRNSYTNAREEYWNIITYGLGFLLALAGMFILLLKTGESTTRATTTPVVIFSVSSLLVFASTIYHYFWDKSFRKILRTIDHISIFFLIAGSYTPFLLISYDPEVGLKMMKIVWSLAIVGTLFKLLFTGKFEKVSLAFYISMGWAVLLELGMFIETTPFITMILIGLGGLFYLTGVIFYVSKSIKHNHAIWHLFVIAANLLHCAAIYTIL